MKLRLLVLVAAVLSVVTAFAQAITYSGTDTVTFNGTLGTVDDVEEIHGYVVNHTGSTDQVVWKVTNLNTPTDWGFTLCDVNNCYLFDIPSSAQYTFTAEPDSQYLWKYGISPYCNAGSGSMEVTAWLASDSAGTARVFLFEANYTGVCATAINNLSSNEVKIYPTTLTNQLTVEVPGNTGESRVDVYNILGERVKQVKFTGYKTIVPMVDLQGGVYMVEVNTSKGRFTKKVVKSTN